ncbi:MAG: universal stress protein [Balneolaceae bacterium]|nr:MAG: universal stress protein [Balneolaceae bacterium]
MKGAVMKFLHAAVALDLSPASEIIVNALPELKDFGLKKITLITVIARPYPGGTEKFERGPFLEKLEKYRDFLDESGFDVNIELHIESGIYVPVTIIEIARGIEADWFILGNTGHKRFSQVLLGSVAAEVIQRTEIATLLLRTGTDKDQPEIKKINRHILFPTDFSIHADRAIIAFERELMLNKFATVLHVNRDESEDAERKLKTRLAWLRDANFSEVTGHIARGNPYREIMKYCSEHDITMIAMGTQGKGFIAELFLGSTSHRIARYSKLPLLLIPPVAENR